MLPCDSIRILLGRRKRPDPAFCGPRGGRWRRLPGRSVGRKPRSPGSCSGTHFPRAGIRRFTPPEPINCAGGVKPTLERETALRLFVRDRLAEGWTPEQISGWLKCGNEPRLRAIGCNENLRLHLSNRTEGRGFMALFDALPQTPVARVTPESRATPSRIERQSMIVRKPLKAAARPAIGRAISSSANAPA